MKTYVVTLRNPNQDLEKTLTVQEGEIILDAALDNGLDLPYSCLNGKCIDCLAKVNQGTFKHTQASIEFLHKYQIDPSYILLCSCSATSDCILTTHQADQVL
jgi:ferredoxin